MSRLRILTAGESHGPKIGAIVEGLPAGLPVDVASIDRDLQRRQKGYGRGYRMRRIETDAVTISSGVRFGETLGGPVMLEVPNRDHGNWDGIMSVDTPADLSRAEDKALHRPRPGHADLAGAQKYDRSDLRDVLERASARNTAARVAAGGLAKGLLERLGVQVFSLVTKIGGVEWDLDFDLPPEALAELRERAEDSEVRCPDADATEAMKARIDEAKKAGDTVGGAFVVLATGLPVGLGSYGEWDRKLDGRIAAALMSIQAVKAVELGIGTRNGDVLGSEAHDEIVFDDARLNSSGGPYGRKTNRAGGLEGGVTNGATLWARGTMKPISTLAKPLESVDVRTKQSDKAGYERSDVCAVPACGVIAEAALAFCLADAVVESFGGDTMAEIEAAVTARAKRLSR